MTVHLAWQHEGLRCPVLFGVYTSEAVAKAHIEAVAGGPVKWEGTPNNLMSEPINGNVNGYYYRITGHSVLD